MPTLSGHCSTNTVDAGRLLAHINEIQPTGIYSFISAALAALR
jgi:hypothetical protein